MKWLHKRIPLFRLNMNYICDLTESLKPLSDMIAKVPKVQKPDKKVTFRKQSRYEHALPTQGGYKKLCLVPPCVNLAHFFAVFEKSAWYPLD